MAHTKQTIMAQAMFVTFEDEEIMAIVLDMREHRFWTRSWTQERDESDECNTMYKLQCELLQVRYNTGAGPEKVCKGKRNDKKLKNGIKCTIACNKSDVNNISKTSYQWFEKHKGWK